MGGLVERTGRAGRQIKEEIQSEAEIDNVLSVPLN